MKNSEKAFLNAVKILIDAKEKQNNNLYRSPCFFYQPRRPQKNSCSSQEA